MENFLGKFSGVLSPRPGELEEKTRRILNEVLSSDQIGVKFRGRTLIVSSSAVLKSELFLRRDEILKKLRLELGPRAPDELSFQIL